MSPRSSAFAKRFVKVIGASQGRYFRSLQFFMIYRFIRWTAETQCDTIDLSKILRYYIKYTVRGQLL